MSLVPIIYTSLLIFASFTLLVIVISYLSFKAKSGHNVRNSSNGIKLSGISYVPKPALIQTAPTKIVPARENYNYNFNNYIERQRNAVHPKHQSQRQDEHTENNRNRDRIAEETVSPQRNIRTIRKNPTRERLEIMNNSERFTREYEAEPNPGYRNAGIVLDTNLLNYYSDGTDMNFSIMNTQNLRKVL